VEGQAEFIQWAVGQGVAIAVLAFMLVKVDARLTDIALKLQTLIDVHRRAEGQR